MVKYPNTHPTAVTDNNTVKCEQFSSGLSAKGTLLRLLFKCKTAHNSSTARTRGKTSRGIMRLALGDPLAQWPKYI